MRRAALKPEGLGYDLESLGTPDWERLVGGRPFTVLGEDGTVNEDLLPDLAVEEIHAIYRGMAFTRAMDLKCVGLHRQGRIGFYVPATGEEALMAGSAHALQSEDWVFPAYREAGVALYRGYPLENLISQLYGNAADFLKGRQMPNHFGSPAVKFAVASSPVGTQIPQAVGAAWSNRLQRQPGAVAVYFGDGATSTGDFHAGLNLAGVQNLGVVFFCKNNGWAISLPRERQTASTTLACKAVAYGIEGVMVDGNDALAVYSVARTALEKARKGEGPTLIEALTYRAGPHSTSDDPTRYRDAALTETWKARDPLTRMRRFLERYHDWSAEDETKLWKSFEEPLSRAVTWAESQPAPSVDSMFEDVYSEMPWHLREQQQEARGEKS